MKTNFYNSKTAKNNLKYKLKILKDNAEKIMLKDCVKNVNAIFYKGMIILEDKFLENELVLIRFSTENYTEEDVMIVQSKAKDSIDFLLEFSSRRFYDRLIYIDAVIFIVSSNFFKELNKK
jgi:hypothetical protein